ncbi:MAG: ATP-binding protein [Desulfurococcales archaeon]|nr:ATP-binding protein [Desulfurococcales archaeon]
MVNIDERIELVVVSGKGGVGKSTLTSSIAIVAGEYNYELIAVDADAEAPNLHLVLGVSDWDDTEDYYEGRTAYIVEDKCTNCGICYSECPLGAVEYKEGKYVINQYICEGCITCSIKCPENAIRYKFKVKAGEIRVKDRTLYGFPLVSGEILPGRPNSGKLVTEVKNKAYAMIGEKGFVLVDAAAGVGCQVISSLTGAHLAVLVTEPTPAGFSDLQRIHRLTKHFMIAPMIVINKYDTNPGFIGVIEEYAEKENVPIIGKIPYDAKVPESMARNKPIITEYPDTRAARAIRDVSRKIVSEILPGWRDFRMKYKPKRPEPYIPVIVKPAL